MNFSKFLDVINESFADAQRQFSVFGDPDEVKQYLDRFKQLSQKNMIKGDDKDITRWIPKGFTSFKTFVDSHKNAKSKRQEKLEISNDAIKVHEDKRWIIIIPLTEKASCKYGANTQWCTAGKENNAFDRYFHKEYVTLFYVISKHSNEKYAIALFYYDGQFREECFDSEDSPLYFSDIKNIIGYTFQNFKDWAWEHNDRIENTREDRKRNSPLEVLKRVGSSGNHPTEEESKIMLSHDGITQKYLRECFRLNREWPEFDKWFLSINNELWIQDISVKRDFLNYLQVTQSWRELLKHIDKVVTNTRWKDYVFEHIPVEMKKAVFDKIA